MGDRIAERTFAVDRSNDRVIVAVGHPQPDPAGDWRCAFHIEGLDRSGPFEVHGVDALQALSLAIEGVRNVLDSSGLTLSWEGGEPGDIGIPRMAPMFLPVATRRKIERYIDDQIRAFTRSARRRRMMKETWRALVRGISRRVRPESRGRPGP
jgi:hypothetical protein